MDQRERFEAWYEREKLQYWLMCADKDMCFGIWQAAEAAALERAAQICDDNATSVAHLERSNAATALTVTAMDIRKLAAPVERGGE